MWGGDLNRVLFINRKEHATMFIEINDELEYRSSFQ